MVCFFSQMTPLVSQFRYCIPKYYSVLKGNRVLFRFATVGLLTCTKWLQFSLGFFFPSHRPMATSCLALWHKGFLLMLGVSFSGQQTQSCLCYSDSINGQEKTTAVSSERQNNTYFSFPSSEWLHFIFHTAHFRGKNWDQYYQLDASRVRLVIKFLDS